MLIDGEASELEVHRLVREFRSDDELTASWAVYQRLRSVVRSHADPLSIDHHHALFARISTAVSTEETPSDKPLKARPSRPVLFGGLALAASLTLAVLIGVRQFEPGLPATAEAIETRTEAEAPAAVMPLTTPVRLAAMPASEKFDQSPELVELDEEKQRRLRAYLNQHDRMTSLKIGKAVRLADLETAISNPTPSHAVTLESNDKPEQPAFKVKWLPNGFKPVRAQENRLHFTDGLVNFSVFVDKPDTSALPEMTTRMGGTVVITRRLRNTGPQVTVVGEVPLQTAKRVAESVESVIYRPE